MKRVVSGFILSLFIFLCGGYTQVYASSLGEKAIFTPDRIVKASLPGTDKIHHTVDATAIEEEDDQPTSKKYIDNSPSTILTYFSSATVQGLPSRKSSANTSCSRSYILLRVFRI